MLSSITPLGERGRGQRWSVTATAYAAGSVGGGAAAGVLAGLLGALLEALVPGDGPGALVLLLAALVLAGAALADATGRHLPPRRRQVDEDWLTRYRGWVYGGGFGLQLGAGVLTIVPSASTWAALGLALLTGSAPLGGLVGATFGLVRALPLLALGRTSGPRDLQRSLARVARAAPAVRTATVAGLAVLAVAAGGLGALRAGDPVPSAAGPPTATTTSTSHLTTSQGGPR